MPYRRKEDAKGYMTAWYLRNRAKISERNRRTRHNARLEALLHYGGNPPRCNCCAEQTLEFLSLDHINGGGTKFRRESTKSRGSSFYIWLRRSGWPEDIQVLCHNCNNAKGFYGQCPHENSKRQIV